MEKSKIYCEKKTDTCYICLEAYENPHYAYLVDNVGCSISGNVDESEFKVATDEDILRDAKRNFQYKLKEYSILGKSLHFSPKTSLLGRE